MEGGGTQGIQFIIQIVLARLLLPEQFGTIAIVMVFIHVAQVFVQSGFGTALIQKKNVDEEDFSSIFYLSLMIAAVLYSLIFLISPAIASFYSMPVLIPVLRILSLILFTGAFNSIQYSFVSRNLQFKKLFKSSLGAMFISGVLGVAAAYNGLGIWALVIQQLTNQISISVIMWFTIEWRPKLVFSLAKVKDLFTFGWKLLASSLLNVFYLEIRTLFIGRLYSSSALGFYNRGEQFPKLIVNNINGSIDAVMLPTLSALQDDRKRAKEMMRRSIVTSSFLIFPMMIGLAVVAEPLVILILTDKWIPAVPFLQMFSISYALMPIHTANLQAINAMGRSDIFLKLEVIKKLIGLTILAVSLPFGVYAIAMVQVLSGIISTFINAYPNKQILNYSYKEQLTDIMPSFYISMIMGSIVYSMNYLNIAEWQILVIQVFAGTVIYIGLAKIFKNESYGYLLETVRQLILEKRKASV
ncbi:Membrane protein involved in the export of O-antigen and teichoic acid [Alkalibacterium subtropicum]|uniref:Membrane protein involved in the export of O-antigen and teichoic acid n=2 Tax=Alkalibacterium subtropicum TaxID=753702 RepID=A0A1I1K8J2_9LACT|nr:Membrane protein involved in the export of O-antigen and teichoic acid [Alkalibacterium subtropicum]